MYLEKPADVLLMGPGPSPVHKRVLEAMGQHTLGHLDSEFLSIMNNTMELLRFVFETENQIIFPVSGNRQARGLEPPTC